MLQRKLYFVSHRQAHCPVVSWHRYCLLNGQNLFKEKVMKEVKTALIAITVTMWSVSALAIMFPGFGQGRAAFTAELSEVDAMGNPVTSLRRNLTMNVIATEQEESPRSFTFFEELGTRCIESANCLIRNRIFRFTIETREENNCGSVRYVAYESSLSPGEKITSPPRRLELIDNSEWVCTKQRTQRWEVTLISESDGERYFRGTPTAVIDIQSFPKVGCR